MNLQFLFILFFGLFIRLYSTSDLSDQYIGCYKDNETSNDLGDGTSNKSMTISSCIEYCRVKRKTYAGTQNGSRCYCGDAYGKYGFSSNCNVICSGNSSYFCGGPLHNSIYAVCPISFYGASCNKECHCNNRMPCHRLNGSCPNGCADGWTGKYCNTTKASGQLSYQGCYASNNYYLPFIWHSQERNNFMTIQWCMNECRAKYPEKSYLFAGLQYAYQCTCGYSNYTSANTSINCGTGCMHGNNCSCSGNSSQGCGGGNANDVYSACQFGYFGPACSQQCHCANDGNCSMETGDCGSAGCAKGWEGTACNIRKCTELNGSCQGFQEVCAKENLGPGAQQEVAVTRCRCMKGYSRTMEHENCTDINECTLGYPDNECNSLYGNCSNHEGSYTCNCYSGFVSKSATSCEDLRHHNGLGSISQKGGVIAGAVIGPLFAILLILVLVYVLYWRRRKSGDKAKETPNDEKVLPDKAKVLQDEKAFPQLPQDKVQHSVEIRELYKVPTNQMLKEFSDAPMVASFPYDYAASPQLKEKNKYKNILPYNKNRVKLEVINDNPLTDYINASYISTHRTSKIIASHGPQKATIDDFWRMIWEQNIGVIVMITKCYENGKQKCEQYWPEIKNVTPFGSIEVTNVREEHFADYVVRQLSVTEGTKTKSIHQCHFLGWPDHAVPSHALVVLKFRRTVLKYIHQDKGIVIHCSAGVGRTGTFIAIDQLLNEAEKTSRVNVLRCLQNLRDQRMNMIQTEVQYKFVYLALVEAQAVGKAHWTYSDFQNVFSSVKKQKKTLEDEYQTLEETKTSSGASDDKCDALLPENLDKNRDKAIVPEATRDRVFILTKETGRNDYINAVFCQGFHVKQAFIQTQLPLQETVVDFWNMCADYSCQLIIVFEEDHNLDFIPSSSLTFENVSVSHKSQQQTKGGAIYDLRLAPKGTSSKSNLDSNEGLYMNAACTTGSVQELGNPVSVAVINPMKSGRFDHEVIWSSYETMRTLCRPHLQNKNPVVVMCRNGCTHSSVFICLSNLADMIESQQEINVFETVYEIRMARTQAIDTLILYEQLYELLLKRPHRSSVETLQNINSVEDSVYANT